MKVVTAKAHESFAQNAEVIQEITLIQSELERVGIEFPEGSIGFAFMEGRYQNSEKTMQTVCLFSNGLEFPIKELHGVLRMRYRTGDGQIAKMTVDFDEPFLGKLEPGEALLVHFHIPVKGLKEDRLFKANEIEQQWSEVRVTPA